MGHEVIVASPKRLPKELRVLASKLDNPLTRANRETITDTPSLRFKKVSINSFILMTAFLILVLSTVTLILHHSSGIEWNEDYPIVYSYPLLNISMLLIVFIIFHTTAK